MTAPITPLNIFRLAALFWLFGWVIKITFFWKILFHDVLHYPMSHPFFPEFFKSPYTSGIAYLLPVFCIPLLVLNQRGALITYSTVATISSMLLAMHFNTCNDATFVSSAWTGLWMFLLAWHLDTMDERTIRHLKISGLCTIGFFFLGGTVGKLFQEFGAGETIYGIFFESRMYWPHAWIRETLSVAQQQLLAGFVAKCIIIVEGMLIFAPLWPVRMTLGLLLMTLTIMVIFCTYNILSVNSCLLGVCFACLLMERLNKKSQVPNNKQ